MSYLRQTPGTRQTYIYALAEPDTGDVRYVGKTVGLKVRYGDHLKDRTDTRRGRWIRRLAHQGKRPLLYVLEVSDDWREAERRWIATYRAEGADLTNHTDGGDGLSGLDAEGRAKVSAAAIVRMSNPTIRAKIFTAERSAAISRALAGRLKTPEHVAKLRQNRPGWKHSPEAIKKIADAGRGRPMPETTRKALVAANTGNQYGLGNRGRSGQTVSLEERRKKSQATLQVPKTTLHATRISEGLRLTWASGGRKTRSASTKIVWPPIGEIEALLDGLTTREVATRLGVRPGTLSAHIHRRRTRRETV